LSGTASSGFRSQCTICGQMKKRKPGLKGFVQEHTMIIFVSGKNSSNGKLLYEYCLSMNKRTHWISNKNELQSQWFEGADSVGVTGATSTSMDQLESLGQEIKKLTSS
ncbi:MAG: 4-hydroxy-3-methylbut-2-enyl diphosphate reductase, partial [Bacteroides sp.]|nr:4-hydroxy-3-methylbut-2-enyl diphosphate reductase [Bacteroides sp.]